MGLGFRDPSARQGPWLMLVWGFEIPEQFRAPGQHYSRVRRLTVPEDTGVLTLLDVGLGLQADGNTSAECLIVKRDLWWDTE